MPVLKMMFFFQRWDLLVPWSVINLPHFHSLPKGGDPKYTSPKGRGCFMVQIKETNPNSLLLWHILPSLQWGTCFWPWSLLRLESLDLGLACVRNSETSWVGMRGTSTDLRRYMRYFRIFQTISPQTKLYQNICWFQWCYLATAHFVGRVIAIHTYLINSVVEKR